MRRNRSGQTSGKDGGHHRSIRRASALLFAGEGATVGLIDVREEAGRRVDAGGSARFMAADVRDGRALEGAVDTLAGQYGRYLVIC